MSPSELLRRRHSPHQRITEREENHEEDSGSGDDSDNGSGSDEGDDGKGNDEDQSTTEGEDDNEDDNEEHTVTEERTITQEHTATVNYMQTVTPSPTVSDVKKQYGGHPSRPDFESYPDLVSWSRFAQLHTAVNLDFFPRAHDNNGYFATGGDREPDGGLWKRHSNSSTNHLFTSTSKNAGELPDKDPYPFDDNDDRGSIDGESIGRTSQWTFEGVATAIRNSMRQSVSGVGATSPGPVSPVSPVSPSGDAASLGGFSSLSRRSSFSYASDDYSCRESAASNASGIYQATALAYPTPGRVTPVMPAYPATAKIVNLSPKPQKPKMVMVRNNRKSSTAELLGLSRNPSKSTTGKSGKGDVDVDGGITTADGGKDFV
ncbi:hypothetical protein N0V85_003810 [Neurospora sp. IMI 360204]|nr:hypothetical protein N0V85_003810 [Neurospora sp. IMI 360204]